MTEDEAKTWIVGEFGAERLALLERYVAMLIDESGRQNLIAPSTIPDIWARHVVDSAQLLALARPHWAHWVDVGSGAGLPGLIVACLMDRPVTLIEPRRLRVAFLEHASAALGLIHVSVVQAKAETTALTMPADVISARAVARLEVLFGTTASFTTKTTRFILPKGAGAQSEVAAVRRTWQGVFHVEQSIVDPASGIVVAQGVRRR